MFAFHCSELKALEKLEKALRERIAQETEVVPFDPNKVSLFLSLSLSLFQITLFRRLFVLFENNKKQMETIHSKEEICFVYGSGWSIMCCSIQCR
jgi:hypothetical protein